MHSEERDPAEADRLLAATIYLMSCHARNGCPRLACMVGRHLEAISHHPDAGALVRDTCRQLAAAWESVRVANERRCEEVQSPSVLETLRRIVH